MSGPRPEGCPLCAVQELEDGPENLIVHRENGAYLVLNLYPYNDAHCMVVPNTHVEYLSELTQEQADTVWSLTARTVDVLRDTFGAHGVNVGVNMGEAAGRSLEHLHVHVVPRWRGDTNFLPVVAETKPMAASLEAMYARFRTAVAVWPSAPGGAES